jgi:hypothetical protein
MNTDKSTTENGNLPIFSVRQRLLNRMNEFIKQYEIMGLYPNELYTLMSSYAHINKLEYDMETHTDLLNVA